MGLVKVWRERKRASPHRPKRVRTRVLVFAFALVVLLIVLLDRFS